MGESSPQDPPKYPASARLRALPRAVWALGLVSLFMDVSSEMIHSLLPLYFVMALGTSMLTVGFIEGVAEGIAAIVKVFSGALSDYWRKRKGLALIGYGMAAVTKPIFPLASTIGPLAAARFIDRIGKGIRGAPRDALIGDIAPGHLRGSAFGLRQALDTIGALLGPLAAVALMALTANDFTTVFWFAVLPAFAAVGVLAFGVAEPEVNSAQAPDTPRLRDIGRLPKPYWRLIRIAVLMMFGRLSEAFLLLRAQSIGLELTLAPLVLVVMNVVYAASAYPAGRLSDVVDRRHLLWLGFSVLCICNLVLTVASGPGALFLGVALWGLHMGLTQGPFAALIVDRAPQSRRGTAFGLFHFATGLSLIAAGLVAGALWDGFGPQAAFALGALCAGLGALALGFETAKTVR